MDPKSTKKFPYRQDNILTLFLTEITGVLECCREIQRTINHNPNPICIRTDSHCALKASNGYKFSSSIVLQCRLDTVQTCYNSYQKRIPRILKNDFYNYWHIQNFARQPKACISINNKNTNHPLSKQEQPKTPHRYINLSQFTKQTPAHIKYL